MARSSRKVHSASENTLQLFPFLSVVACTLGSIMLLIIIISTKVAADAQQNLLTLPENEQEIDLTDKEVVYIECSEAGVNLYPSGQFVSEDQIDVSSSQLNQFLSEVQEQENGMVYVLIRPSGVGIFDEVRNLIEQKGIEFRYEPIDENWQLDT